MKTKTTIINWPAALRPVTLGLFLLCAFSISASATNSVEKLTGKAGASPTSQTIAVTYSSNDVEALIEVDGEKYSARREGSLVTASHFVKGSANETITVYLEPFVNVKAAADGTYAFMVPGTASGIMCQTNKDIVAVFASVMNVPNAKCVTLK